MVCDVMSIASVSQLTSSDLVGKRVVLRVDFNVPIQNGIIQDESRIRATLPTIKNLQKKGARLIIVSHLGRPNGSRSSDLSLLPVSVRLADLLKCSVSFAESSLFSELERQTQSLNDGDIMMLENIRFFPGEEANDPDFSQALARLADVFVNDAFGAAHRKSASTEGVAHFLPSYAGLLMESEIAALSQILDGPAPPFCAIIGGAKVSSKLGVLEHLLEKVDHLIIGGGMAFTFLKAQGVVIGKSLVEDDLISNARDFLIKAKTMKVSVHLPVDQMVAQTFSNHAPSEAKMIGQFSDTDMGLDIGPKSIEQFRQIIENCQTILWNGPMGVFEMPQFSTGTQLIARCLATHSGTTIVGGGDSVAAINQLDLGGAFTHVSTGGGACLEFLEGRVLPGISTLKGTS